MVPQVIADLRDKPQADKFLDKLVRILLEHGANPNARNNSYRTPLHIVTPPKLEVARIMIEHGAESPWSVDVDTEG